MSNCVLVGGMGAKKKGKKSVEADSSSRKKKHQQEGTGNNSKSTSAGHSHVDIDDDVEMVERRDRNVGGSGIMKKVEEMLRAMHMNPIDSLRVASEQPELLPAVLDRLSQKKDAERVVLILSRLVWGFTSAKR
jgi:hypothetical protein